MAHTKAQIEVELKRIEKNLADLKPETAAAKDAVKSALLTEDKAEINTARAQLADLDKRRNSLKSDMYLLLAELKEIESKEDVN